MNETDLPIMEPEDAETIEVGAPLPNGHDPEAADLACLDGLADRAAADVAEAFKPEVIAALVAVRAADRGRFEALRGALKAAGVRVTALDQAIRGASPGDGDDRPTVADRIVDLALEAGIELFHAPSQACYAAVPVDGHIETWPVGGAGFRRWLVGLYYDETSRAPNGEAVHGARAVLEAKAAKGAEVHVFLRCAAVGDRIYLDLCDSAWRVIEIDSEGWRILDSSPVRFRRMAAMAPLAVPVRGGSIDELRDLLNTRGDSDFTLTVGWMLAALRGRGPYPILAVSGEQGSAKSTLTKILRSIVDPSTAPLRSPPREERDLFIGATNGYVLAFDNCSGVSNWLSDGMCRLATGGGFATRTLRTDGDETIFAESRPMVVNGIEDILARPDLADRSIPIQLEPIAEDARRTDEEVEADAAEFRPRVLGALLDAVATGLRHLDETQLDRMPRMASVARWVTACDPGFTDKPGAFLDALERSREGSIAAAIEGDPVASAVRTLVDDPERGGRGAWGPHSAASLMAALADVAGDRATRARTWPPTPRALTGRLRRLAPVLRAAGIQTIRESVGRGSDRREGVGFVRSDTSDPVHDHDDGGRDGVF